MRLRPELAALLVIVLGAGCRKGAPAGASPPDATADELARIEAELARNAAELGSLGVMIAQREPAGAADEAQPIGAASTKNAEEDRRERTKRKTTARPGDGDDTGSSAKPSQNRGTTPDSPPPPPPTAGSEPTTDVRPDPVSPTKPAPTTTAPTLGDEPSAEPESVSAEACGRICGLAEVACDLSDRICALASRHDGDARYEEACWNAQRQCEAATDACDDCDPESPGACADPS